MIGIVNLDLTNPEHFTKLRDASDLNPSMEPKFYTLVHEGKITGKILGYFGYCINSKSDISDSKFKKCFSITQETYNVDFSVIGLRNLDDKLQKPRVEFNIKPYGARIIYIPEHKARNEKSLENEDDITRIATYISEKHNGKVIK